MSNVVVLADSIGPNFQKEHRLITLKVTYWRAIHAEVMSHRSFSRNGESSRAVPTAKKLKMEVYCPEKFGKKSKGMQSAGTVPFFKNWLARRVWLGMIAVNRLGCWTLSKLDVAKQWSNRPFEWCSTITLIITADYDSWMHFLSLRDHPDAQPEMQVLAKQVKSAIENSVPNVLQYSEWHIPYDIGEDKLFVINGEIRALTLQERKDIAIGLCAGVSYLSEMEWDKALRLGAKLKNHNPPHACYDKYTEVLTSTGFKLWKNVTINDVLASVDLTTENVEFCKPTNLYSSEYTGKMYHLEGQAVDLCVTPNHNLVIANRKYTGKWTDWRLDTAENTFGKPVRTLKSGLLVDSQRSIPDLPMNIDPISFGKLLGFFIGDGACSTGQTIVFNIRVQRKIDYLKSLPIDWRVYKSGEYVTTSKDLGKWFTKNCYNEFKDKKLPDGYLFWSKEFTEAVIDGMKNSDGSIKNRNNHTEWGYYTMSPILASQFQELLHINKLSTQLKADKIGLYKLIVSQRLTPRIETNVKGRAKTYSENWIDYSDMIYCAEVKYGTLIVRRNGKVVVSGNSPMEHIAQCRPYGMKYANFNGWMSERYKLENIDPYVKEMEDDAC